jgi:NAD(P)-dependent dehydrogenase (short-subunit alcohol dehydrogenase family)
MTKLTSIVAVAGANGDLGGRIAKALVARGATVLALVRPDLAAADRVRIEAIGARLAPADPAVGLYLMLRNRFHENQCLTGVEKSWSVRQREEYLALLLNDDPAQQREQLTFDGRPVATTAFAASWPSWRWRFRLRNLLPGMLRWAIWIDSARHN